MKYKLNIEFQSDNMEEVTKIMERISKEVRSEDYVSFSMKSDNFTDKFKRLAENIMKKRGPQNV